MKIAICTPVYRDVKAPFAACLANMVARTTAAEINYNGAVVHPAVLTIFGSDGQVDALRIHLARRAIELAADYILWVDADQTFDPDALLRLAAHDKPIVGCNIAKRDTGAPTAVGLDGQPVNGVGLQKVGAVGFGFCLTKVPIFDALAKPWFKTHTTDEGDLLCGEDVHFCNQARQAGFAVHVDHDLRVGHIADNVMFLGEREGYDASAIRPSAGP